MPSEIKPNPSDTAAAKPDPDSRGATAYHAWHRGNFLLSGNQIVFEDLAPVNIYPYKPAGPQVKDRAFADRGITFNNNLNI